MTNMLLRIPRTTKVKFKFALLTIILLEFIFLLIIGSFIFKNLKQIFSRQYITNINRKSLDFPNSKLKYFYEPSPEASNLFGEKPPWLHLYPQYNITSDTLNEHSDYSIEKPSNTHRIVTIGDSVTFGLWINTENNFSEQLEDLLNNNLACSPPKRVEVINLGVPGYDVEYTVERFAKRGQKYNPDTVIWFLHLGNFQKIQELIIPKSESYNDKKLGAAKAGEDIIKELGIDAILNYQEKALYLFNNYFKNKLIIVSPENWNSEKSKIIISKFKETRLNTDYYSLNTMLKKPDNLLPDNHPNEIGHKLIAQDIFNYLKNNFIIPCETLK